MKFNNSKTSWLFFLGSIYLLILPACNQLFGRPDENASLIRAQSRVVHTRYVETLRNKDSLLSARYVQSGIRSVTTSSLNQPTAVTADSFRVYVLDQIPSPHLTIFDRSMSNVNIVSEPTPTFLGERFLDLSSVAVTTSGVIFISDRQQGKIFGLDRIGNLIQVIGKGGQLSYPTGLAVDSEANRLYISDKHTHSVHIFSLSGDWIQDIIGQNGVNHLSSPSAIALDATGSCYVLDSRDKRIHVYNKVGIPLNSFPIVTDIPAELVLPIGLAVDSDGHIYITDTASNDILIFDKYGSFLQRMSDAIASSEGFWSPSGIFIDKSDLIYIADRMNGRIQVFQYEK